MTKCLEALKEIQSLIAHLYDECEILTDFNEEFGIIEKELKAIEIINKRGIKLIIPEGTFSKEHIDIQLFTNTLKKEELLLIKEILDL